MAFGALGAATEGAPPGDQTTPDGSSNRAALPAPAADYLKGGIRLFNTGDQATAAKYLKVASDYRDQLQSGERDQLDGYLAKLNPAPADPAVKPASTGSDPAVGAPGANPAAATSLGTARGTTDLKQEARWKLQGAREQVRMGNYDEAMRVVQEVQKMNVKWGLFDETPAKLAEVIAKARPKAVVADVGGARDKKQAMAKLKEARELIANNQSEQAEALSLEVNSWGLNYSVFEDSPKKVAAAARAIRKRELVRNAPTKLQPSMNTYDYLVSEARHKMTTGELDEAEAKARQALRMNVYPSPSSDRAEAVLNDIATARAGTVPSVASTAVASASPMPSTAKSAPIVATPSVVAERKANELLAKNQTEAAAALFAEADRLRASEIGRSAALDLAVRKVAASPVPAPMPALDSPTGNANAPAADPLANVQPIPDAPVAIADPAAPPAILPPPDASALQPPTAPSLSADAPPIGNRGEELLSQSKALFSGGNYAAAREKAAEAKAGQYGLDAQADEMLAQIALSEQGGALAVYEAALDALRKNDIDRARAMLNEVAASGAALDEGMLRKVQDLLIKLPKDGSGKAMASDVPTSDIESMKAQQMNMEVGTKVAEARRLMETDPEKAIALLQMTLASVKAAEMPQTVARTMTRRLEVAIELAKKDKVGFDSKMLDKNAKAEVEIKKLRILEADKAKKGAIAELMAKAQDAQAKGDWAKAEELARRAGEVDPDAIGPQMLAFKANMQRHYETDKLNKRNKEEGFLEEIQSVDAAMIINNEASRNGISYPKNFPELAARRRKMQVADTRQKSVQEISVEKKLNEPITLNLQDQTLDDAIKFISNYTGLNVIVDPKALNDEGLSRDSKVSLTANSIKLKNALKFMLRPLNLTFKAEDEVLLITSTQASRDKTYTWTYPVADLVVPPNSAQLSNPAAAGYPISGPNDGIITPGAMGLNGGLPTNGSAPSVKVNQKTVTVSDMMPLIQLITTTIEPNTWKIAEPGSEGAYGMGGGFGGADAAADRAQPGSITPFLLSISLIIRHTAEVHEQVAELLRQLRRLQDLQVSIEVRFITVSDDFFEQIGVDFDFNIQSKTVGKQTTFAAPSGSVQAGTYPFNLVGNGTTGGGGGGTGGGGGGRGIPNRNGYPTPQRPEAFGPRGTAPGYTTSNNGHGNYGGPSMVRGGGASSHQGDSGGSSRGGGGYSTVSGGSSGHVGGGGNGSYSGGGGHSSGTVSSGGGSTGSAPVATGGGASSGGASAGGRTK